jgi:hypothetical protein
MISWHDGWDSKRTDRQTCSGLTGVDGAGVWQALEQDFPSSFKDLGSSMLWVIGLFAPEALGDAGSVTRSFGCGAAWLITLRWHPHTPAR